MLKSSVYKSVSLLTIALMVSCPALASPVPEPVRVEANAAFIFEDGRVERLIEDRGDLQVWATRRGREYVRARNFTIPILEWEVSGVKGKRQVSGKPEKLWPPRAGASSRFRVTTDVIARNGDKSRSLQFWTCKAGKNRMETFSFGEIKVLPVVCDRYTASSMKLAERRSWLWSDEIGHYVERTSIKYSTGKKDSVRLCAKIPGWSATEERIREVISADCP